MADKNKDVKIGLIPCAVGGTRIDRWMESGDLWSNAVKRAKIALKSGKLKGILWHQGESDATSKLAPKWGAKFESMIIPMPSFANIFVSFPNMALGSSSTFSEQAGMVIMDNTSKIKLIIFKKIVLFKIDLVIVLENLLKIVYNIIIQQSTKKVNPNRFN